MELVLSSLLKFSSVDTAKALLDPPLLILRRMSSSLRSASALAASWQCQRCDPHYTNDSAKNKTTESVAYEALQLTQPSVRRHVTHANLLGWPN